MTEEIAESEWDILKKFAAANNTRNEEELYKLLRTYDLSKLPRPVGVALNAIELNPEKVSTNKEVLLGFVKSVEHVEMGWREKFRYSALRQLLGLDDNLDRE